MKLGRNLTNKLRLDRGKTMKKNKLSMIILMFFAIYYPQIISINIIHIVAAIAWGYCLLNYGKTGKVIKKKKVFYLYAGFFCMFFYLTIVILFNETTYKNNIMDSFMWLAEIMPICIMIAIMGMKRNISMEEFVDILLSVGMIQGVLSVLNFMIPSFHNWFVSKIVSYGYDKDVWGVLGTYRLYGLAHSLTFFMPILQSVFFLISMYFFKKNMLKYAIYMIVFAFSAIINARTPIIIVGMGILFLLFQKSTIHKINKKALAVALGCIIFLPLVFNWVYNELLVGNNIFEKWIMVGFMSIIKFFQGERSGYFSYFDEGDRFVLPNGAAFWFGVGKDTFTDGGIANVHTDVGYINYLWLGGVIYLVIIFLIFLSISIDFIRSQNNLLKYIGWLSLGIAFVGNIKGILFAVNEYTTFVLVLAVYYYVQRNSEIGCTDVSIEKG